MKTCRRCVTSKPLSEFRSDSRYADGRGSWCMQCHRQRGAEWAKENRARLTEKARAWRAKNPKKAAEIALRSSRKLQAQRAEYAAQWTRANRDKRRATTAKRKAALLRAKPTWADEIAMARIYAEAARIQRETGVRHHVDHMVPLQSPLVCGLHCEANLQILPGPENEGKRNFHWPDMPRIDQARMFA